MRSPAPAGGGKCSPWWTRALPSSSCPPFFTSLLSRPVCTPNDPSFLRRYLLWRYRGHKSPKSPSSSSVMVEIFCGGSVPTVLRQVCSLAHGEKKGDRASPVCSTAADPPSSSLPPSDLPPQLSLYRAFMLGDPRSSLAGNIVSIHHVVCEAVDVVVSSQQDTSHVHGWRGECSINRELPLLAQCRRYPNLSVFHLFSVERLQVSNMVIH